MDSLQDKGLYAGVLSEGFGGTLWAVVLDIDFGLFAVDDAGGGEVADLVTEPCGPVVTSLKGTDGAIRVGLQGDL